MSHPTNKFERVQVGKSKGLKRAKLITVYPVFHQDPPDNFEGEKNIDTEKIFYEESISRRDMTKPDGYNVNPRRNKRNKTADRLTRQEKRALEVLRDVKSIFAVNRPALHIAQEEVMDMDCYDNDLLNFDSDFDYVEDRDIFDIDPELASIEADLDRLIDLDFIITNF